MSNDVILYGAGGHATSVVDALLAGGHKPAFIVDDDPGKKGQRILQTTVRGPMQELSPDDLSRYAVLIAIAINDLRKRIALDLNRRGAKPCGVRHPSAIISPHARVHPTAQILAGVIVNAGAVVQSHAVLNTGCIIEHDCIVGEFCHIGPGAVLAGAVVTGEGVFVATGAKVCPFVRLGGWSTVGAGAVVLHNLAPHCLAVGVPARSLRKESRS
ncbi:MAG TPA: NeuD/PglB/VioB family sugar acetyltransferase [Candidatus Binatia bacterium]|jgi:acetyltransferase EpsM|nr:NeuD/PglB/VioB family sugar acetyltransferase [Candidatus Binatia bacterium]